MTLQDKLIKWFHQNARPLPWRRRYDPYEVWISEMMLQQTQVETVLPYYERWMKSFPDIESLAKSNLEKVLKHWEGLGYYNRARNLHETAKRIVQKLGGAFPQDYETILSLKGIGRYTAGAIASIAFNQEKPIVDGNVLRVLSRLHAIPKPIDVPKNREIFWQLEEKLIPKGGARFFNQALMELGALICKSENPLCLSCPLSEFCAAFKKNEAENYPVRQKKKDIVKVEASAAVLSHNGKYLITRRPLGQIMGGLWEFPEWKLAKGRTLAEASIRKKTLELLRKDFGLTLGRLSNLATIKRNYTHHQEILHVFSVVIETPNGAALRSRKNWPLAWAPAKDFQRRPFSSAHSKIAKRLS
ncbi:MAG: A/G-specific adenine glycosylase [Candidatus Omnitrophica bacterium]|nr:A/G-specific adenine glycosylase [Candidatus Omnitrophota bacterium]